MIDTDMTRKIFADSMGFESSDNPTPAAIIVRLCDEVDRLRAELASLREDKRLLELIVNTEGNSDECRT